MSWPIRLALFAGGLLLILIAIAQLHTGQWVFNNASYHQTTFAAGGIAVGAVICLLAFLPSGDWVYRHISTKTSKRGITARKRHRRHKQII